MNEEYDFLDGRERIGILLFFFRLFEFSSSFFNFFSEYFRGFDGILPDLDIIAIDDSWSLFAPTLAHTGLDRDIFPIFIELDISFEAFLDEWWISLRTWVTSTDFYSEERHDNNNSEEFLCIIEWTMREDDSTEREYHDDVECSRPIADEPGTEGERSVSRDVVLEIECFQVREKCEYHTSSVFHHHIALAYRIVEHRISAMSDHIARDRHEHRDHRWDECREKEDKCEKRKKLQYNPENRIEHEWIECDIAHHEHPHEDNRLECDHEEHHERESDEFPEDDTRASYRLREHEIDGTSLDLTRDHPSTEEEYHCETCELDEWETKVIEYPAYLSERESLECEWYEDKYNSEKKYEGEKFISHEFADGILCYSEHRK